MSASRSQEELLSHQSTLHLGIGEIAMHRSSIDFSRSRVTLNRQGSGVG